MRFLGQVPRGTCPGPALALARTPNAVGRGRTCIPGHAPRRRVPWRAVTTRVLRSRKAGEVPNENEKAARLELAKMEVLWHYISKSKYVNSHQCRL